MMKIKYNHHNRTKVNSRKNTPIVHKGKDKTRKNNRVVYDFLMHSIDPLYYNLIYRNPQWIYFNDDKSAVNIIFRNHEIKSKLRKSEQKLYISKLSSEIITRKEFISEKHSIKIKCFNCSESILVNYYNDINKRDILCSKCVENKYNDKDLICYLNNIYEIIKKYISKENKNYLRYLKKNY